jgi:hypothetical protein
MFGSKEGGSQLLALSVWFEKGGSQLPALTLFVKIEFEEGENRSKMAVRCQLLMFVEIEFEEGWGDRRAVRCQLLN